MNQWLLQGLWYISQALLQTVSKYQWFKCQSFIFVLTDLQGDCGSADLDHLWWVRLDSRLLSSPGLLHAFAFWLFSGWITRNHKGVWFLWRPWLGTAYTVTSVHFSLTEQILWQNTTLTRWKNISPLYWEVLRQVTLMFDSNTRGNKDWEQWANVPHLQSILQFYNLIQFLIPIHSFPHLLLYTHTQPHSFIFILYLSIAY